MTLLLGIDTGGTYTDAALLDERGGVVGSAKALTTKHNLTIGIRGAVDSVLGDSASDVALVSLSTTLATNAIVEGQGSPVCLLLIGYAVQSLELSGLREVIGMDPVVFVPGGHTVEGAEQQPLDLETARQAILRHAPNVAAFAVSGHFAVRNPDHELQVRDMVRQLTGLPVSCGHELTTQLDAPRRAVTTVLNARLIPLLQRLILAVRELLAEKEVRAPLMVVKGDGSLVDAGVALERPVETILSGPAASVVGAHFLAGEDDAVVSDMGGTTTDVAVLRGGHVVLNADGASVGGWRTMVEAAAVHTFGLGGDSEVRLDEAGQLVAGPRRVVPLSLLAVQRPGITAVLQRQLRRATMHPDDGRFAVQQRSLDGDQRHLTSFELEMWRALAEGPVALADLLGGRKHVAMLRDVLMSLVDQGLIVLGGFTPSDAAHVLGYQRTWSEAAARWGAELWVRRLASCSTLASPAVDGFCKQVVEQVVVQAGEALVTTALAEADQIDQNGQASVPRLFLRRALSRGHDQEDSLVGVSLTLQRPVVAIGAPVGTYYPAVAERLHTRLVIPPHADVANAVGAVAGSVAQTVRILITPTGEQLFRVHLPTGTCDYDNLEAAASVAASQAHQLAEDHARRAGAGQIDLRVLRHDRIHRSSRGEVFLETDISATAIGRPRLAGE